MIVTEEEAKTKRCQESFGDGNLGSGFIEPRPMISTAAYGVSTSPQMCIGSACMAWRWQDNLSPVQQRGAYGYCGKAGKP